MLFRGRYLLRYYHLTQVYTWSDFYFQVPLCYHVRTLDFNFKPILYLIKTYNFFLSTNPMYRARAKQCILFTSILGVMKLHCCLAVKNTHWSTKLALLRCKKLSSNNSCSYEMLRENSLFKNGTIC